MAKNLKLKFKNTQLAKAVKLGGLKDKLAKRKAGKDEPEAEVEEEKSKVAAAPAPSEAEAEAPKVKARSKSIFAEGEQTAEVEQDPDPVEVESVEHAEEEPAPKDEAAEEAEQEVSSPPSPAEEIAEEEPKPAVESSEPAPPEEKKKVVTKAEPKAAAKAPAKPKAPIKEEPEVIDEPAPAPISPISPLESSAHQRAKRQEAEEALQELKRSKSKVKLGPTGRHIKDLLPPKPAKPAPRPGAAADSSAKTGRDRPAAKAGQDNSSSGATDSRGKQPHGRRQKEYKDVKPLRKQAKRFDSRDRMGLRDNEEGSWRRRRGPKQKALRNEALTVRPTELSVRIPITVKDLAGEMKLKSSELITKLFMQGVAVTINDYLDDETTIQFLGSEFGCAISIDTSEEERIRITGQTVQEEIAAHGDEGLGKRAPVVAFMGHVDHGKTSLIDRIRSSNRVSEESGAITQHIGAFRCTTDVGEITILDTPGHEAFSAMRARGADVTDLVVLVVAGDEGIRQQTLEAIQHAKAGGVEIIVAINKCDKPGFDPEKVYRQLADNDLLPEAWGGQIITVNCSAMTGEGVDSLLEMLALQSEVLELRALAETRARGRVLESEMHKGMGIIATLLVQNGTLRPGDAVVFEQTWGRVKTMRDENGRDLEEAGPSVPVEITGLSRIPSAGEEFIVVENEKEAREIAEVREQEHKLQAQAMKKRPMSIEGLLQAASDEAHQKVLNVVLRADVQGSLEALKVALTKIESEKVRVEPIFAGVGEVSESDVQLAAASGAVIVGFHTKVESHAEGLLRELGVRVHLYEVIYHAIEEVTAMMEGLLDKVAKEEERGVAEVLAVFRSSQLGKIAGCIVKEGVINRNCRVRLMRGEEEIWRGPVEGLKRHKDDAKEVAKGLECGILLKGFNAIEVGDRLEAFEVTYIEQEL